MSGDDVAAQEAFFRKTEVAVTHSARRLGRILGLSNELVEDAIQGAYEVAFGKWAQLNDKARSNQRTDALAGWICVTARNKVLSEYRRQRKYIQLDEIIDIPDPDLDIAANVTDHAEHIERFRLLQKALEIAPEQVVEMVALYLAAEGTHIDRLRVVAASKQVTDDAVRKRFSRAIQTIQRIMAKIDEDPEGRSRSHE